MVKGFDDTCEQRAQKKTDQRHQRLKSAEPRATDKARFQRGTLHAKSFAHGHCKSIHTDAEGQYQQFPKTHRFLPLFLRPGAL